jgi:3-deoxy-D-arabino-heptulosonate 7-phosphate (DAHP) synthase
MPLHRDDFSLTATDAINRVLVAERDANRSVTAAGEKAAEGLEAARQRAAHILRHADNRITLIHQRCSQGVARAIDRQVLEHHRRLAELSQRLELDDARIDAVVADLAAALTGATGTRDHDAD